MNNKSGGNRGLSDYGLESKIMLKYANSFTAYDIQVTVMACRSVEFSFMKFQASYFKEFSRQNIKGYLRTQESMTHRD